MINCLRPSNRSSRLTLPLGPSNSYFFSINIHGIRRRSAAMASRARVNSFSLTSSCCRAASHSCCDTIGGVFIAICPCVCSLFLSLLVAISFLLYSSSLSFIRVRGDSFCTLSLARQFHGQCCQPAGGDSAGNDQSHASPCKMDTSFTSPGGRACR